MTPRPNERPEYTLAAERGSRRGDGEEPPLARNALQRVGAPVLEADSGACHEILDRIGDQDLTRPGLARDASADVDGDAAHFLAHHLALARVQTGPHLDSQLPDSARDGACAPNRAGGAVESGEHAVTGRVDLPSAEARQLPAHGGVVAVEQGT